jgi:hypothetical protein
MAQCGFVPLRLGCRSLCVPDRPGRSRRPVGGAHAVALRAMIVSAGASRSTPVCVFARSAWSHRVGWNDHAWAEWSARGGVAPRMRNGMLRAMVGRTVSLTASTVKLRRVAFLASFGVLTLTLEFRTGPHHASAVAIRTTRADSSDPSFTPSSPYIAAMTAPPPSSNSTRTGVRRYLSRCPSK